MARPRRVAVGELGARVARASRSEAQRRLDRLRERAVFIAQCGVAAGLSWFLARWWLGHPAPVFAPVTAIVCLGLSYGHRVRRALELMLGVAVGVVIGDLFVQVFGAGPGQVAFVVALAMASAALLGSGQLITTQAGVQALFVIGYAATPTQGLSRWLEALVGGLVAVVFALAVPRATFTRPRAALTDLLDEIVDVLHDTAEAVREHDAEALSDLLDRGRATDATLSQLRQLSAEARAVVRQSPLQRRQAPDVQRVSDLVSGVDVAIRNLRVLLRRSLAAVRQGEQIQPELPAVLDALAEAVGEVSFALARELDAPEHARRALVAVGEAARVLAPAGLSAEVVRAQVRSMVIDLLVVTGLDYEEALEALDAVAEDDASAGEPGPSEPGPSGPTDTRGRADPRP